MNNHIDIPFDKYFNYPNCRQLRSSHELELAPKFARTNLCKYSYFYRTVEEWNGLPSDILCSLSCAGFSSSLRDYMYNCEHNSCDICGSV